MEAAAVSLYIPGGEWYSTGESPHAELPPNEGSTPSASTNPVWGVRPEKQEHKLAAEVPDVTWAWGEAYPCRHPLDVPSSYCPGWMRPGKRCFRYLGVGRLWRRYVCDKCGRRATDWKTL